MYVVYKCRYVCMCTKSTPMSLYTYLMSLNMSAKLQIWPYATYACRPHIFAYVHKITQPTAIAAYVIAMFGPATNKSPNMPDIQISSYTNGTHVSINTLYEFSAINNITRSTVLHTFHITGIYP